MSIAYRELTHLVERLHRRLLDVVRAELTRADIHDLNGVQALLLANVGDGELARASEPVRFGSVGPVRSTRRSSSSVSKKATSRRPARSGTNAFLIFRQTR